MRLLLFLFFRFIVADLFKNKVRTLLTLAAIAIGVAVFLSINLANRTALSSFKDSVDQIGGTANLEIRKTSGSDIDEQLLLKLKFLDDRFVPYTPVLEDMVQMTDEPAELVQVTAIDMFADPSFKKGGLGKTPQFSKLAIFKKNHALVGANLAEQHGIKPGDEFSILVNDRVCHLRCADVLSKEGLGGAFAGQLMVLDTGVAQELLGKCGRVTRIDIVVTDTELPALQSELSQLLGVDYIVDRPHRRQASTEKMLRSFQYNLAALSMIALLVAGFLIYNTVSIGVIRRRWELGTLRALGLSRGTVGLLFFVESVFMGVTGSALGLPLGTLAAGGALDAVSRTVRSLYADQPQAELIFDPAVAAAAFGAGVLITVLSAAIPSQEALSIAPAEALRKAAFETRVKRSSLFFLGTSATLVLLSVVLAQQPAVNGFPFFGYGAAATSVFAAAFLTPCVLSVLFKYMSRAAEAAPLSMRLAVRSLSGAPGRTSVTVAALMVGIAMMVSLSVMIGSFRKTVAIWVEQTLKADLFVEPAIRRSSGRAGVLSPETLLAVKNTEGVAAVDAFCERTLEYEGLPTNLGSGDLDVMASYGNLPFLDGDSCADIMTRANTTGGAVVSEPFALKHHKKKGDILTLPTDRGPLKVKVEGIYYDYSSDLGFVVLPYPVFSRYFDNPARNSATVFLKPGYNADAVRLSILRNVYTGSALSIRTNAELKNNVMKVFDNTFAITYALHIVSVLVAILGIANSLVALIMESRRELGILRYLGTSKSQIESMIFYQSAILGGLGAAAGVGLGILLSHLLIHVINKQSFGWSVQFFVPVDFLAQSVFLVIVTSLFSGILPARMAARTPAPEAVRQE